MTRLMINLKTISVNLGPLEYNLVMQ